MDTKKLWPTLIALIPLVAAVFTESGQAWLAAPPTLATLLGAINVAIANLVNPKKDG